MTGAHQPTRSFWVLAHHVWAMTTMTISKLWVNVLYQEYRESDSSLEIDSYTIIELQTYSTRHHTRIVLTCSY
jgi:hypothetical protein